ncbi:transposase, partial [Vibrio fluvialis]|nr:transposase [Vibrio fluvialis]
MPKPRYKTTNWCKYNNSLLNRGSLTFWIDEEAISEWKQSKQDKRGRPRLFSDLAIRVKKAMPLIPPREVAAFWEKGHLRNLAVGCQKLYGSNKKWKRKYGYHRRSLSE